MKALKYLPLIIAVALSACGEKKSSTEASAPSPEASASAPAAAPAASEAASAASAAAPAASAAAPAASEAASAASAAAPAASAAAPAPAASASAAAAGAGDLAKGESVFKTTCQACHGAGVLGAPKFGDKAAWGPRIAKGKDALYNSALNGFKMMPPRGGNAALKDDEIKAAVDYMVSKAS